VNLHFALGPDFWRLDSVTKAVCARKSMISRGESEVHAGHERGWRRGERPMIGLSVCGIRFIVHFFIFRFFLVSAVLAANSVLKTTKCDERELYGSLG
jgi:hypothetical protein